MVRTKSIANQPRRYVRMMTRRDDCRTPFPSTNAVEKLRNRSTMKYRSTIVSITHSVDGISICKKNASLFLSFPYVCPEPVLVKGSFYYKMAQKRRFLTSIPKHARRGTVHETYIKNMTCKMSHTPENLLSGSRIYHGTGTWPNVESVWP